MSKKTTMSKGRELEYSSFETQSYLQGEYKLSKETQLKILHLRIRDVSVKSNYPRAFSDRSCSASVLCSYEETQKHVYSCQYLAPKNQISSNEIQFELIFGNCTNDQEVIEEIFFQRFKRLKELISSRNNITGRPGDPRIRLGIKEAR